MPKFSVRRFVDAYVYERAIVEADDVGQAIQIAYEKEVDLDWISDGHATFDDTGIIPDDALSIDGDEIPEPSKLFDLTDTERFTIVSALRGFKSYADVMRPPLCQPGAGKILDDAGIDRLCEEFNV